MDKPIPEAALQAARVAYGSSMPDEERMRSALASALPHLTAAQQQGQAVAVVGERGSVSWSGRIPPLGAPLYTAPPSAPVGVECPPHDSEDASAWLDFCNGNSLNDVAAALAQQPAPSAPVGVEGFEQWYARVDARFWNNWDACNAAFHAGKRAALAQQPAAVAAAGWVNVADGLPELDEPVWAAFKDGGCGLFVRVDPGDGWAWCNTYGNVDVTDGRWVADDAEFDDEYQPIRWHRLPPLNAQDQETTAHG